MAKIYQIKLTDSNVKSLKGEVFEGDLKTLTVQLYEYYHRGFISKNDIEMHEDGNKLLSNHMIIDCLNAVKYLDILDLLF